MQFLRTIWTHLKALGRRMQARAVIVGLWLLYWLGLGPVRVLISLFRRDLLSSPDPAAASFWLEVDPSDYDPSHLPHQS